MWNWTENVIRLCLLVQRIYLRLNSTWQAFPSNTQNAIMTPDWKSISPRRLLTSCWLAQLLLQNVLQLRQERVKDGAIFYINSWWWSKLLPSMINKRTIEQVQLMNMSLFSSQFIQKLTSPRRKRKSRSSGTFEYSDVLCRINNGTIYTSKQICLNENVRP